MAQITAKRKSLIYVTIIILIMAVVFDLAFSSYWLVFNKLRPGVMYARDWHYKYNKSNIIGRTEEDIVKKYGDFDKIWATDQEGYYIAGYQIDPDSGGYTGSDYPVYYNLVFPASDENRKCICVSIEVIKGDAYIVSKGNISHKRFSERERGNY